jgi:hypothetical protein
VVHRDAGRCEHLLEDAQGLQTPDPVSGDRDAGRGAQLGGATGMVEGWRVEPHPLDRVLHDGLGQFLGCPVV